MSRTYSGRDQDEGFAPVVEPVISCGGLTEQDCAEFPTGRKPGDPYTNVDSLMSDRKSVV